MPFMRGHGGLIEDGKGGSMRGGGGRYSVSNLTLSRGLSKFLILPARLGDKTIGIHSLCLYAVQHFDLFFTLLFHKQVVYTRTRI